MKNSFYKKFISIVLVIMVLALSVTTAVFSWFDNFNILNLSISGTSVLNYFAGGTGTKDNPFLLNQKNNLYHLAWLQNLGKLQDKKYYFKLLSDIDMQGLAVPPIGTETLPFIGCFDGNFNTISNLFVSNNKLELKTNFNISQIQLGNKVGFFGAIDSGTFPYETSTAGEAYNFYLENINIASNSNNSVVGIVAGHNNGSLYNIGVSNNSFKLSNGITTKSEYALIGENGSNTEWVDSPSYFGNKLLIDPNDSNNLFTTLAPINGIQQYRAINTAVPEHAYMTSSLGITYSKTSALFKITANNKSVLGNITTWTPSATRQIYSLTDAEANGIPSEFWSRYSTSSNSTRYIVPSLDPAYTNTMAVPFGNSTIQIPYNGVWFKPKGSGSCGIAFSITNQSNDAAMAIYEYKRDGNGNIIDWNETRFVLEKGRYGNSAVVYFDYDVKKDYEYVVGKSTTSSNTAGFFYLILGGVGDQGGGTENMSSTQRIDYVMRDLNNQFPNLSDDAYELSRTHLSFDGTSSSSGYIYLNKTTYNLNTAVYYYSGVGSVSVKENVYENWKSAPASQSDLQYVFYDWMSLFLST